MPKEEWGVKRVCPSCSTRFYDLMRDPMTCPACAHEFTLESLTGNKSRSIKADKEDAQTVAAKAEESEEDLTLEDDEDDADIDLGDDVLEEDDDDDNVSFDEIADVAADDDDS